VQQSAENNKSLRYNLAGQRVDETYKGIVIENGKKYLVK
jgi:alpha-amylase